MPLNCISDLAQDLIIERARTAELQTKLAGRDNQLTDLSYAVRTQAKELNKLRSDISVERANIKVLTEELLEICSKSPIDEAEARRRALALARITAGFIPIDEAQKI